LLDFAKKVVDGRAKPGHDGGALDRSVSVPAGITLFACLVLAGTPPAFAHAMLDHADPSAGSVLHTQPGKIVLDFTEAVEPAFCKVELRDSKGAAVAVGKPQTAPGKRTRLITPVPQLAPGTYTVIWHATSVDTHKTEGRFGFTVAP
jgi:methionine-rich copper-binding protein CopC